MIEVFRLRRAIVLATVLFLPVSAAMHAQTAATWTVQPEWVKAHEEFLSSDDMKGRGSATPDEKRAADYVASKFEGYGLQHAPGMNSYIQSAEVHEPEFDGHATLNIGGTRFHEGTDFTILMASGENVSERLVHVPLTGNSTLHQTRGSVLIGTEKPANMSSGQVASYLRRAGGAMVVVEEDPSTSAMLTMFGGKTRVPMSLAGASGSGRGGPTVIVVKHDSMSKFENAAEGAVVSLDLHPVKNLPKRETYNAVGYLPGSDPHAGTLLLTAHLDHLGVGRPVNGDSIYNGANDDAAGTTAVMELAHALGAGPKPRRSVLFVCYGSEEAGELGSTYFGEHPPVPLKELIANLEFEMIGNQDPKMPKNTLLLTGWERSNLGPTLKEHGALLGPDPYPEQHFFERSDNYALALKGVVAHTAAGWGDPPTYHQPDDDMQHLDLPFMTAAIQSLIEPVRWLASSDFKPEWNKGGQPKPRQ
ncbi:MAG TPA: M28 family peptidase [Acidobacteriaceae bacterium]|jgi:hypothetical protein